MPVRSGLYAMCGVMRCGASRCGDASALVLAVVGGVLRRSAADGKITTDLVISEQFGQGANTATMRAVKFAPVQGQELVITLGSVNCIDPIFAGRVLRPTKSIPSAKAIDTDTIITSITGTDYTFDANERIVNGQYSGPADEIAIAVLTRFAPQLSTAGIVSGLPDINEISMTDQTVTGALSQIASRIGGYSSIAYQKRDDKPIARLYLTPSGTGPMTINAANVFFQNFKWSFDLAKTVTRVFVEGNGSTALSNVAAGDSILPIVDVTFFNAFGGLAKSGQQRIGYSGVQVGGAGSLVGPGAAPSSPPGLALSSGTGVDTGLHRYAYTFLTAAGESLPSPIATITTKAVTNPASAPTLSTAAFGSNTFVFSVGATYHYKFSYLNALGETVGSAASALYTVTGYGGGGAYFAEVTVPYSTDTDVTQVRVQRTKDGGSTYYNLVGPDHSTEVLLPNNPVGGTVTILDNIWDTDLVTVANASNTTAGNRVTVAVPLGGPTVTGRKVYRSAANLTQLKLQSTIADNTTPSITDSTADASLGANAPVSDTSGLTQPTGQVVAGSTSLLVAGTGAFSASGGWASIGNGAQVIRYTGITGSSLTGIPAIGAGAITAPVAYNSTVTAAPALTGIAASGDGSIEYPITVGDDVNLVAQCDDLAAQAALAALLGGDSTGVREAPIQDRRLSFTEATSRGLAFLQLRSTGTVTVALDTRDKNTAVGKDLPVDLDGIVGTFKIQTDQITSFVAWGSRADDPLTLDTFPLHSITASNERYSLEDILRQIKGRVAA